VLQKPDYDRGIINREPRRAEVPGHAVHAAVGVGASLEECRGRGEGVAHDVMERPGEPQRTASFRRRAVGEEKGDHGLVSFEIVAFGACSGSLPEVVPRTVNGTGHTGPSRFCATSPSVFCAARQNAVLRRSPLRHT
jgi:hypothetical protein